MPVSCLASCTWKWQEKIGRYKKTGRKGKKEKGQRMTRDDRRGSKINRDVRGRTQRYQREYGKQ